MLILFDKLTGVHTKDSKERARLYVETSNEIYKIVRQECEKEMVANPRGVRVRNQSGSSRNTENAIKGKVAKAIEDIKDVGTLEPENESSGLDGNELKQLAGIFNKDMHDVTQLVNALAHKPDIGRSVVVETTKDNHSVPPNMKLVEELEWIRNLWVEKQLLIKKNLETGKINQRGLHKAPINGLVFKEREQKKEGQKTIWLCMDRSGSMESPLGRAMYSMCAAVHMVLPESRIYAYDDTGGKTRIYRCDDNGLMRIKMQGGGTPSGDAIIYTCNALQQTPKGGIVVHFTDGGSNTGGVTLADAHEAVEKMGKVNLINVILGGNRYYYELKPGKNSTTILIENEHDFASILRSTIEEILGV